MEDKGTTITPIFQFAKNNGLDEKEFFDFVKSKTGADITPEHGETQGFLEKMFDEYADKKFKERPKRDIFTDKDKEYLDYEVVNDKALDAIKDNFTPPSAKGEEPTAYDLLDLSEKVANEKDPIKRQALAGEYLQKRGGKQNALGEWEFEDEHGTYKPTESGRAVYSKLKDAIDTNDNGKIEVDEMADFQKSLDDYAAKNKKGREDIPARYRK